MSRVNTRIRTDVRDGDLVYKNNRGWWVPAKDFPIGSTLMVWQKGSIREPTSVEFTTFDMGVSPVTPEAKKVMEDMGDVVEDDSIWPIVLALIAAFIIVWVFTSFVK